MKGVAQRVLWKQKALRSGNGEISHCRTPQTRHTRYAQGGVANELYLIGGGIGQTSRVYKNMGGSEGGAGEYFLVLIKQILFRNEPNAFLYHTKKRAHNKEDSISIKGVQQKADCFQPGSHLKKKTRVV